jgi:hypothetical protein
VPTRIGSSQSASSNDSFVTSLTWAVTVPAGVNRVLTIGLEELPSPNPSTGQFRTVTWNGQSLIRVGIRHGDTVDGIGVEIWYLPEAQLSTATANAVITTGGSTSQALWANAQTWSGVDQVNPIGPWASAFGGDAAPTLAVATRPGSSVVDMIGTYCGSALTLTSGFTGLYVRQPAAGQIGAGEQCIDAATGASTSISWALSPAPSAAGEGYWYGAVALNPVPALGARIGVRGPKFQRLVPSTRATDAPLNQQSLAATLDDIAVAAAQAAQHAQSAAATLADVAVAATQVANHAQSAAPTLADVVVAASQTAVHAQSATATLADVAAAATQVATHAQSATATLAQRGLRARN